MGWKDLLESAAGEYIPSPWVGGRSFRRGARTWTITGALPLEHGWFTFALSRREARIIGPTDPAVTQLLGDAYVGYLVGDRLVNDKDIRLDQVDFMNDLPGVQVHLIEPGLDRFARIEARALHEDGPVIFMHQAMPLGPEDRVRAAYQAKATNVDDIKDVTPGLVMAFRFENWLRDEATRRRAEAAAARAAAEAQRAKEEQRARLIERLGDAQSRRALAKVDFGEAAKAALAVGGAEFLDFRAAYQRGEYVVAFRLDARSFECTCDETLRIIDAGICLTSHGGDGYRAGTKGDKFFTLESLPAVIRQARDEGKLVVLRHIDDDERDDYDD